MLKLAAFVTLVVGSLGVVSAQQQSSPALRIVVLEGEGGVNIIQQKTAVRPLVEVRDRNNVPISGASVTFTIGGGNSAAFAGGAQTLTVTTNAAGQAAASGLNPLSSGAFQIQVQAAHQGQIATAAISQTNFVTAAAAAAAGATAGAAAGAGAGASTGAAAGGAAGAGGGISGVTIGIVGAAVAGGAVAVTQVAGKDDESGSEDGPGFDSYNGTLSGQITVVSLVGGCTRTRTISGTIGMQMNSGNATGVARMQVNQTEISFTGNCIAGATVSFSVVDAPITGGPSSLAFSSVQAIGAENAEIAFTGALSGTTISGNIDLRMIGQSGGGGSGSTRMSVTLTR
jgi:hypothetical protein